MKLFWRFWLLACAALPATWAEADTSSVPQSVTTALEAAGIAQEGVGIFVHDLNNDRTILSAGADLALNPASVIKLVTTFAALELLGPAYTWKTEAYLEGTLADGRLEGNLVLKGYGDPDLTLEHFWLFLRELRSRGLREIAGDLVLDRSFFSIEEHEPGEFDNAPTRPYNVGPDALLLNFKSFRLHFVPEQDVANGSDSRHPGLNPTDDNISVFSVPDLAPVTVINNFQLAPGHCDIWPHDPVHAGNTLTFSGLFPAGCGEKSRSFSLLSANDYMASVFRQLWLELGGSWSGEVRDGLLPDNARLFASRESAPLAEIIRGINKSSNNVMARQLYLTLGTRDGGVPATLDQSNRVLWQWADARDVRLQKMVIDNGSGLSRTTRITARELGEMMRLAWRSQLMPEFVASLPVVAVDGTMRKRLSNSPVAGQAHVKTSYLDGVRAIAGFVNDSQGHTLAVAFLINDPAARHAQAALDALLEWTVSGAPEPCCQRR